MGSVHLMRRWPNERQPDRLRRGIKAKGTGNGTLTYIRPTGTKSSSANGTGIDVTEYASVDVAVSGGGLDLPTFTILWDSGFTSIQSATCD